MSCNDILEGKVPVGVVMGRRKLHPLLAGPYVLQLNPGGKGTRGCGYGEEEGVWLCGGEAPPTTRGPNVFQ